MPYFSINCPSARSSATFRPPRSRHTGHTRAAASLWSHRRDTRRHFAHKSRRTDSVGVRRALGQWRRRLHVRGTLGKSRSEAPNDCNRVHESSIAFAPETFSTLGFEVPRWSEKSILAHYQLQSFARILYFLYNKILNNNYYSRPLPIIAYYYSRTLFDSPRIARQNFRDGWRSELSTVYGSAADCLWTCCGGRWDAAPCRAGGYVAPAAPAVAAAVGAGTRPSP